MHCIIDWQHSLRATHEGLAKVQNESFPLDLDAPLMPLVSVTKIIKVSAPKSCCLDLVPIQLVKECNNILVLLITRITNKSFVNDYIPKSFKLAAVIPLLKKADLIPEILKNFRQISNLPFLPKNS